MKQCFIVTALVSILLLGACAKNDPIEPPPSEQVGQGILSANGTVLLNGGGAPSASLGKNGDFYLDKTNLAIYGPKTDAGWGEPTSIKGTDGKDGADGKDGSKILSGTEVPTLSLGAEGDFYFDTQNLLIYGPKTATSWGNPVSLIHPGANGVTVLLYKEHSFQHVVRNLEVEQGWNDMIQNAQSYIQDLQQQKSEVQYYISQREQEYNDHVAWINNDPNLSPEDKVIALAHALEQFNDQTSWHRNRIIEIDSQIANNEQEISSYQNRISIGSFNVESIIPIDERYHDVYDKGLVIVQIKKSNDPNSYWRTDGLDLFDLGYDIGVGSTIVYKNLSVWLYEDTVRPDRIVIYDNYGSRNVTEAEIRSAKMDIKILLIPATTVVNMSARNVDTRNLKAVTDHLGL